MPAEEWLQLVVVAAVAGLLLIACWHDVATRTLPDGITLALAVIGVGVHALSGGLLLSVVAALLVFLGGALAWRLGAFGGGDVKLLAACALVVGAGDTATFLLATAICGGLLATVYLVGRSRGTPAWALTSAERGHIASRLLRVESWRIGRGGPLPYGVAIAAGTLLILTGLV